MGIVKTDAAQRMADEKGLDLVKIAPQGKPPVCKLMDYSKFKFEQQKRAKDARKNQKTVQLREVRLSATIDKHDLEVKAKTAERLLKAGDKVKISIRFRGRQMSYANDARRIMEDFFELVKDYSTIERKPLMEGRNMIMILAPSTTTK